MRELAGGEIRDNHTAHRSTGAGSKTTKKLRREANLKWPKIED
jgi:hypothetical protein